jgi:nucleotide-binding universal stress UspA family protein
MEKLSIKNILVPTDLSESSVPALRYARLLADRFNANLTVMHADTTSYPVDMFADTPVVYSPAAPEESEKFRSEIASRVKEWLRGRPYEVVVVAGQPASAILHVAEVRQPDLIVMGTHGRRGWRRALLGSVAETVLHTSTIPVVTVGAKVRNATQAVTTIVCPINFTEVAADALRYAAELADAFGAELIVLHAVEAPGDLEPDERARHETRVRGWIDAGMQASCTYREVVLRGNPAERVLDCTDDFDADLLVIGAQHTRFRDATAIGTTTERLVRFAECPVLTIARAAVPSEVISAEVAEHAVPAP